MKPVNEERVLNDRTAPWRTGIDAHQARTRMACGMELPRSRAVERPKLVPGIVTNECQRCGCTTARAIGDKNRRCQFCGHVEPRIDAQPAAWLGSGM